MAAKTYFTDEAKGILRVDLFDTDAEQSAKRLIAAGVTRVQLRRHFGEVRALEARLRSEKQRHEEDAFERIRPYLGLLKAKAQYSTRHGRNMQEFARFFRECVDGVTNERTFRAMVQYLEAVVAYFMPDAKESGR